jgi:malate dehydrogenase (oxaloacetate-decarboxylating)
LIGGIHPARTLPIVLDVGTNNSELLRDPQYLGWRHERVAGQAYFDFIDQFVTAVQLELPLACLQWEDFAKNHARPILNHYRDHLLTFNDDIQGTAAVVLGTILSAAKATRQNIKDMQIVLFGAGSAAIGVADYLRDAMVSAGLPEQEARSRFWIVNSDGLLHTGRQNLTDEQIVYAQPQDRIAKWAKTSSGAIGLAEVIGNIDASVLIGLCTVGSSFTEPIVREMARKTERPIILPLSNPTQKSEAIPQDLVCWSDGRAIIATGSPFAPVQFAGRSIAIAQCNNIYIFPAVGLGAVASRAWRITDGMMQAAARTLAEHSPALSNPNASLLPLLTDVRSACVAIAIEVGAEAQRSGVAPVTSKEELARRVHQMQWNPQYAAEMAACPRT